MWFLEALASYPAVFAAACFVLFWALSSLGDAARVLGALGLLSGAPFALMVLGYASRALPPFLLYAQPALALGAAVWWVRSGRAMVSGNWLLQCGLFVLCSGLFWLFLRAENRMLLWALDILAGVYGAPADAMGQAASAT